MCACINAFFEYMHAAYIVACMHACMHASVCVRVCSCNNRLSGWKFCENSLEVHSDIGIIIQPVLKILERTHLR